MPMRGYAQIIVMILALAVVWSAGRGIYDWLHASAPKPVPTSGAAQSGGELGSIDSRASNWQSGVAVALDASVRDAEAGQITEAEIDVDRAAGILQTARLHTVSAAPDFFSSAIDQLERVIRAKADTERLAEHTRLAEIALAELRSSMAGRDVAMSPSPIEMSTVEIHAPRAVPVNVELNSKALGGKLVDASSMPESAEILEPPSTRAFGDNIRVDGVSFSGASQTLDGIRWKNVAFIGTRLRYEGGELSLQNVEFVRCTFGFNADERGARLAKAIALGQSSLVIE
jgi:hypothetical protein